MLRPRSDKDRLLAPVTAPMADPLHGASRPTRVGRTEDRPRSGSASAHMNREHRHVVVGGGGLGPAALSWLARATGSRDGAVLGLEAHHLGHDHGASQDHSRIIRYA